MNQKLQNLIKSFLLIAVIALSITSCKKDENKSVESVTIDPATIVIKVGEAQKLTANINPVDASNTDVTWSSSDNAIAVVASDGSITALKVGSVTITVSTEDGAKTSSCTVTVKQAGNNVTLEGEIKGNRNLSADSVYLIKGFVYVVDGAKLTIPAGTILKGDKATMGSLIIEKGGKLDAQGTSAKPIVFTSSQPKGARTYGDWGGIILCGKAKINPTGGDAIIEGGPRSHYGGTDDTDNSGILKYIRIEFAGYPFAPDKEINGLTFAGVGSGTVVDYIQVSYSADDSYEWFGGTVNCKHLVAFRGLDDEFDTDFGYSGKIQFAIGMRDYRKADISGSNGFESDNDATGSANSPFTSAVFSNISLIGPMDTITKTVSGDFKRAMHLRRNTNLKVYNSVFAGWPTGLMLDGATTWANAQAGNLQVKNSALVAMKADFEGASGTATSEVSTWFNDAARSNKVIGGAGKGNKYAGIFGAFLTTDETKAPVLLPKSDVLLSGASFTGLDAFFTQTSHIGAFGTEDWTAGWANWNPQGTDY